MLCRLLVADGWHVVGTTRKTETAGDLETLGVEPAIVDVFDASALRNVMLRAQPAAVIHQLTDLPSHLESADLPASLERTARLREIGTRHLVDACIAANVGHLVAQSIAFAYAMGRQPFTEDAPLDVNASDPIAARTARAIQVLERLVLAGPFRSVVLRYGRLYGPGTWRSEPSARTPVHVDAAADAARRALLQGNAGVYNVAEPDGTVSVAKAVDQLGWDPSFRAKR